MWQYLDAVKEVLTTGTRKPNRTGVDTLSTFNINYEIDLADGFPLLTTKKMSWKNIVIENLWFLSGSRNIDLLRKHGCRFWDPWADENGEVPSAYGNFWRHFPVHDADSKAGLNDQIEWLLTELKRNPMSRRLVVSAWAPGNAQTSALPPCHCLFVLNVQNAEDGQRLNLHLTQRSCDMALGVPYNIAGYAFLLCLLAHLSGIRVGVFAHTLVDAHIYTKKEDGLQAEYDHIPGLVQQMLRDPLPLPRLRIDSSVKSLGSIEALLEQDTQTIFGAFDLVDYQSHPSIKFKVAV